MKQSYLLFLAAPAISQRSDELPNYRRLSSSSGCGGVGGLNSISCGRQACVALKNDATAEAWGQYGGDASGVDLTNVAETMCGEMGCLAKKNDDTVVVWGAAELNPDATDLTNVAGAMCGRACVAWKHDGTAVAWGNTNFGTEDCLFLLVCFAESNSPFHLCASRRRCQ